MPPPGASSLSPRSQNCGVRKTHGSFKIGTPGSVGTGQELLRPAHAQWDRSRHMHAILGHLRRAALNLKTPLNAKTLTLKSPKPKFGKPQLPPKP